jgi:hypothetical protein
MFDGHRILICHQVDDLAVYCCSIPKAALIIQYIAEGTPALSGIDLTNNGLLWLLQRGVDVGQTQHYVKVSCECYLRQFHDWHPRDKPSTTQPSERPIEPLSAVHLEQMQLTSGHVEGSLEHTLFEKEKGFSYWSVLGD